MTTNAKTSPKDVFMQLLSIVTLYLSAFGFGGMLFQYINIYLPDILTSDYYQVSNYYSGLRGALATLVIVFPVYIWTNWFLTNELIRVPEKLELRTRKWLLYFTVFASAGVIIGDLISLIYNFLQGELTTRFILKIIVILMIAGAVFGYYLWVLRRDNQINIGLGMKVFIWSVIAVVGLGVVTGFFVAGSPQVERLRKLDQRRVEDLQNIQSQIIFFWQQKNVLPNSLDDLRDSISGYIPPQDPETKAVYEYSKLGDLKFKLCADFKTEAGPNSATTPVLVGPMGEQIGKASMGNESWQHTKGLVCFDRTIDPVIWKPIK